MKLFPWRDTEAEADIDFKHELWFAAVELGHPFGFWCFPDPANPPAKGATAFKTEAEAQACCERLTALSNEQFKALNPDFFMENV